MQPTDPRLHGNFPSSSTPKKSTGLDRYVSYLGAALSICVASVVGAYNVGHAVGRSQSSRNMNVLISAPASPASQQKLLTSSSKKFVGVNNPNVLEKGSGVSVSAGIDENGQPTFIALILLTNKTLKNPNLPADQTKNWCVFIPISADVALNLIGVEGIKDLQKHIEQSGSSADVINAEQFKKLLDESGIKISAASGVDWRHVLAMGRRDYTRG